MNFQPFQDVILTRDVPEHGLQAGDVGVVVEHHAGGGKGNSAQPEGYSVEFFDMTGQTVAVITVPKDYFRQPTTADRPAVRELSHAAGSISTH